MALPLPRRPALAATAALLLSAALAVGVPGGAGAHVCGGLYTGRVTASPAAPRVQPPPLVVGDSVMMPAVPALGRAGFHADAQGCRMWSQGLDLVRRIQRRHRLPHLVVLELGTNWTVRSIDIRRALAAVGPGRVLGLVTPRKHGGRVGPEAALERRAARAHPGRIVVLDWVRASTGHPEYFQPDRLHLAPAGAQAFAGLVETALRYATAGARPR